MAAFDVDRINKIDSSTKSLINGYFRDYQRILSKIHDDNPYYNIPQLSIYVTLSYFAVIEYFHIVSDAVILSKDKTSITRITDDSCWQNTNYGRITINPSKDKGIYQWYIQIKLMQLSTYIGFQSDSNIETDTIFGSKGGCNYSLNGYNGSIDGMGYDTLEYRSYVKKITPSWEGFNSGDIVCIEFNMNERFIKFYINDKDYGIAFKSEEIKDDDYRFAVSLCDGKDCFILHKF